MAGAVSVDAAGLSRYARARFLVTACGLHINGVGGSSPPSWRRQHWDRQPTGAVEASPPSWETGHGLDHQPNLHTPCVNTRCGPRWGHLADLSGELGTGACPSVEAQEMRASAVRAAVQAGTPSGRARDEPATREPPTTGLIGITLEAR